MPSAVLSEDDRGNFLADRARGHFWHLGLLDSGNAGDEVHLLRPPEPRPLDDLVPDVEYDEERDVDVCETGSAKRDPTSSFGGAHERRKEIAQHAQEVRNVETLKLKKTVKPLMRMKMNSQNVPQYARYGCSGL